MPHFTLEEVKPTEHLIRVDVTGAHHHIGNTFVAAIIADALKKVFGSQVDVVMQCADGDYHHAVERLATQEFPKIAAERIVVVDMNAPFQMPVEVLDRGSTTHLSDPGTDDSHGALAGSFMDIPKVWDNTSVPEGTLVIDNDDCPAAKDGI